MHGGADARRVGGDAEAEVCIRRGAAGPGGSQPGASRAPKKENPSDERTAPPCALGRHRVNRARHEFAQLVGYSGGALISMTPFDFDCAGENLQAPPQGALHRPARRLLAVATCI